MGVDDGRTAGRHPLHLDLPDPDADAAQRAVVRRAAPASPQLAGAEGWQVAALGEQAHPGAYGVFIECRIGAAHNLFPDAAQLPVTYWISILISRGLSCSALGSVTSRTPSRKDALTLSDCTAIGSWISRSNCPYPRSTCKNF